MLVKKVKLVAVGNPVAYPKKENGRGKLAFS